MPRSSRCLSAPAGPGRRLEPAPIRERGESRQGQGRPRRRRPYRVRPQGPRGPRTPRRSATTIPGIFSPRRRPPPCRWRAAVAAESGDRAALRVENWPARCPDLTFRPSVAVRLSYPGGRLCSTCRSRRSPALGPANPPARVSPAWSTGGARPDEAAERRPPMRTRRSDCAASGESPPPLRRSPRSGELGQGTSRPDVGQKAQYRWHRGAHRVPETNR